MDFSVPLLITLSLFASPLLAPLSWVLIVYVDDIIIYGDDSTGIVDLKRNLSQNFHTKDLGSFCYFIGIDAARSSQGISAHST